MEDGDRWRGAEERLTSLQVRLAGAPAQVKQASGWKEADRWARETLEQVSHKELPAGAEAESWWEEFERFLALHGDALEVAMEQHRRSIEQDKLRRQQQWAGEKERLKTGEASFLMLKVLMILSWTIALGLGLSTQTLGLFALAPAVAGCLEIYRQLRALPPNEFVVERQAMYDLRDKFKGWFGAFVAAGVIGTLFALVKTLLVS